MTFYYARCVCIMYPTGHKILYTINIIGVARGAVGAPAPPRAEKKFFQA